MLRPATLVLTLVLGLPLALTAAPAGAEGGWVTLSGHVTDASGRPLRHIRIEQHDPADPDTEHYRAGALTDENGDWTLRTGPGTFYLEAEDPFYLHEFRTTYYPAATDRGQAEALTFEPDANYRFDFTLGSAAVPGASATSLDTTSRESVAAAYRSEVQDLLDVGAPVADPREASTCVPTTDRASTQAMLRSVNFARSLAQTDPLTFPSVLSARTARRALIHEVNQTLHPESSPATCNDGKVLRDTEDSVVTDRGPAARGVAAILADQGVSGSGDQSFPAATPLLIPALSGIGAATDGRYTVLDYTYGQVSSLWYPFGDGPGRPGTAFRTWPTPGYFPQPLSPRRWSFEVNNLSYDLSRATISVQRTDGSGGSVTPVAPVFHSAQELIWTMPELPAARDKESIEVAVTVANLRYRDQPTVDEVAYTVRLIDPTTAIKQVGAARVLGNPEVGSVLTGSVTWDSPAVATHHQWLRDGRIIAGATGRTRVVATADIGHQLAVVVRGSRPHYRGAQVTSSRTPKIRKKSPEILDAITVLGRGRLRTEFQVNAPGERNLGGKIMITRRGKKVLTLTVRNGHASGLATHLKTGTYTLRVAYTGTPRVAARTMTLPVLVR